VRPLDVEVTLGSYWFTHLKSRPPSPALSAFRDWLVATART